MTSSLLTANKVPAITRSRFTQESSVTFPAGGIANQAPIINLTMLSQTATERVVQYLDIGQTDADKDLDVIDDTTLVPLYVDPAFAAGDVSMLGILPPKCIMVRCLTGSGLLYINVPLPFDDVAAQAVAPIQLHENAGIFLYAFPRGAARVTHATDPTDPTLKLLYPLALVSLHLRTFETNNRFQIVVLK